MKKQYANPELNVVFIEDADIVTNSIGFGGEDNGNQTVQSKRRENIWDE